jgi:hypothetical protein
MSDQEARQGGTLRAVVVPAARRGVRRVTSYVDTGNDAGTAAADHDAPAEAAFVWGPAGLDHALALACEDLRAGSLFKARPLLERTRERREWAQRGYVSAVLGALARATNLAETWVREDKRNPDAWLLWARTAGVRALRAHDEQSAPGVVDELRKIATRACDGAQSLVPADPTPQVIKLSLDRLRFREPLAAPVELGIDAPGPWDQFHRVYVLDPANREAGHHLLAYFQPRHGGAGGGHRIAEWIATDLAPADSPLRLLPLYAEIELGPDPERQGAVEPARERHVTLLEDLIEEVTSGRGEYGFYDQQRRTERIEQLHVALEEAKNEHPTEYSEWSHDAARELHHQWFGEGAGVPYAPVRDLSVLADFLHDAGAREQAADVLRFLSPHASDFPWSRRGAAASVLAAVYEDCEVPIPGTG